MNLHNTLGFLFMWYTFTCMGELIKSLYDLYVAEQESESQS
jgi:hypothetical protein